MYDVSNVDVSNGPLHYWSDKYPGGGGIMSGVNELYACQFSKDLTHVFTAYDRTNDNTGGLYIFNYITKTVKSTAYKNCAGNPKFLTVTPDEKKAFIACHAGGLAVVNIEDKDNPIMMG